MVTKLEAIRAKYPVYNDLSDQQLADAFYNKFYTDTLDKSAFYDQVGLTYSTPENIGRAVTGMPGRMLGSIYGDNMQVQAEQSTAEIEDYKKRFAENRAATDTGFNPLDIITELFGDSEKKYRAQTSLIDFAGTKGLPRPRNEADFEKLNALLRDPAMQQEFIGFLQKQSAVDELKGKLLVQSAEKLVPETRVKPDDWVADLAVQTAASLADMAPTLAVGLATSGAPGTVAGLATLFFQARGTKYKDMRKTDPRAFQTFLADKGFKGSDVGPELAGKVANLYAAFEAIPEAVPLSKLLLGSAKSLGRNLLEYGIIEPGSEVLTELGQIGTDVLVLNENMTNDEVLGRIAQAYVGGLAMSGVYAGVNAVANKVREPQKIDEINRAGPVVGTEFETLVEDNLDATPEQAANPEAPPMLMLPPPDKTEPYLARRQPQVEPSIDEQGFAVAVRDTQDRFNEQNRKDRTALLARSAKEQLKPIYITNDEANAGPISGLLGDKLTDIRAKRILSSRNPDAPITLPELKAARVSAEIIDQIKNLKQPATAALKVMDAEKRGLDPLEFPETIAAPATLANEAFTEDQYKSAVMAIEKNRSYSFGAMKSATGITNPAKLAELKKALFRRGQLVETKNGPVPANQMRNERMTVPSDLPEGAVVANVVRELPVGAVRVRQTKNGKTSSLGVFNTLADARAKISSIRAGEDRKGGAGAQLGIEPAGRTAFGVVQKRYDKEGNFIGEVVIDSFATEAEARKAYDRKVETPPAPVAPTAPAAPQQHRVVERQNITGYKLSIDGNERAYPATEEGARQLIQDEAAAPEGAKVERSDVTEPMFELVRDNLNAQGKTVGTSKSMGLTSSRADADAEAARLNSIGTVRDVAPKGLEGRVDEVVAALTRVAEQMGLPRIGGKVVLQNVVTPAGGTEAVEGVFGRDGIIRLTVGHFTPEMTTEEIVAQLSAVLRHEAIHQLRRVGVLMPETGNWNALLNYARNAKDPKGENGETFMARAERMYNGIPGYDTEAVQEEAVAEAFRSWADGKIRPSGKPASIFRKIVDWFRRLIAELPEDVFSRVDSGQLVAERVRSPGASNRRNIDRNRVDIAVKQLREANAVADENAKRVATTEYLAARDQAREDNAGRSGFKTVLGTDANKPYAEGEFMPPEQAAGLVSAYKERAGLTVDSLPTTLQPNVEFMQKVAKAQEKAEHTPNDPLVKRAYAALTTETKTMFNSLGVTVEPWRGNGQPYASAADMGRDIAAGRIKLRLTEEMFGATPSTANHPMRQNSGIAAKDGTALTNNDLFRVVHDIFGYNQIGLRPGYDADFTAYHEHSRLYSDQARRAYATETLAQDAWHHFGPHLWRTDGTVALQNDVDFLPSERKEFAKQKAFLLPEDLLRSDPAFEQIKNAEAGDLEQFSDERFSIAPVNVMMTEAQRRVASRLPGGKDYGRADLAPATVLSAPGTPAVALIDNRDGNRYFGGEVADEQLRQAQDGDRGATVTYMTPENFVALAGIDPGKDQQVFDAVPATDYKFNALPSLTFTGDKGIVRVAKSDGAYAARALIGKAASIPVVIYPERGREFGLINGVTNGQTEVLFDNTFPHDYYPERRGERFSVGSEKFQKWFKDSKVVGPGGQPLVLYHGTGKDFTVFDTDKRAGSNIDSGFLGRGAYLTNEPRVADYYAEAGLNAAFSPNVMPVYASLQNPFMWGTKTQGVRGLVSRGERLPEAIHDEVIRRTGFEFDPAMDPDFAAEPGLSQAVTDILREKGYDGVIATFDGVPGEYVAFEPTQIKSAIGNNGNWDAANPDIRYSMNTVGLKVPVSSPVWANDDATDGYVTKMVSQIGRSKTRFLGTSVYDQRVKLQDKFISLEDMAENARRSGGVVNDLNDTYQVQQLSDGRAYYQIQDAEETLYAPLFEAIHEAHKNGVSIDDVETYLLAKHAPERNAFLRSRKSPVKDPSGMSDADAYAFIDKMRTEGKAAQLEAIANLAYKITRDTTRVRIEGGLITAQDAAASPFKFYVPLKGLDPTLLDPDDNTADLRNVIRTGRGYSVSGRESRSPTGRTSKAYNILGHLITQNTEAVLRAEKNRVAVSLVQFIKDNPNSGVGTILKKVPTRLVRSTNGMIRSVPDQQYRSSPDIVIAKVQGREVVMRITDTWVARAMRSDNIPRINKFFQIAGTINRYLATINTAWNPEFLITNLFRDAQTAAILGNRYNIESFSKAIIADAPKAIVAIREVIRTGRVEGEMAQYFDEMRRGGGTTEFLGIKNADQQVKALRGLLADTQLGAAQGKVVKAIKAIGKTVEDYNKVAENALRLAAYANARRAGATVEQAAYISKNLTVNFNKGGEYKGIVNSLYLFYNASLAGSFVLLKGLKNKKVQRIAAGIVAAGFLLDMVNRVLSGDEDDDGIKDYDEIPEYILRTNLIIMRGGKDYIAIPMPYGFNFFHNVGRNISAVVNGSPTKDIVRAVLDSLEAGFDSFNPLGGSGSLLNVIAPTVLDPVVDIVTNRDFANKPIVPERPSFDGLPIPNSQKFWNSTGGMYKDVAAFVNGVAGGNEVIPGAQGFDWSPEILEYAVEYAFGAAGSFVERGANLVNKVATGSFDVKEDFDQIPFLRKTAGTVTSRSNSDRFYTQAEKVMLHDKQIRSAIKLGDSDTARARSEQNPELTQLIPTFKAIDNQLAALRKRRRAIEKNTSLTPEAIREQVKAIREREDALMRQASVEYLKVTGRAD